MSLYAPAKPAAAGEQGAVHTRALAIITLLFFLWGLLTSLNDVLIPHLKAVYDLSYVQAMLVQSCFFGAYFLVSLPAGYVLRRIGYQRGVVLGLLIAAIGCALFYPASSGGYGFFLSALFILASGITVLQVAANPFVTVLGPPASASSRLTLTQAFNSLGTTVAPIFGGMLILGHSLLSADQAAGLAPAEMLAYKAGQAGAVQLPYLGLASLLLLIALCFALVRLPQVGHAGGSTAAGIRYPAQLVLGAIAIFMYVGAEVAIGSFLINFLGEPHVAGLTAAKAAHYIGFYWGGAMCGRFAGFMIMRRVSAGLALAISGASAAMLLLMAMLANGPLAMWSVIAVGLCNSIMFPTIFSMALHRLGPLTEKASSILCMAIVGGAVIPFIQGYVADIANVAISFAVPLACYMFVLFYGYKFRNLYREQAVAAYGGDHVKVA